MAKRDLCVLQTPSVSPIRMSKPSCKAVSGLQGIWACVQVHGDGKDCNHSFVELKGPGVRVLLPSYFQQQKRHISKGQGQEAEFLSVRHHGHKVYGHGC